jgi:transcriptional accessory protein Tex/SPT6
MAWKRIKHPSEVVEVGQEVTVNVLKFDKERNRVSLGLKQLGEDPWLAIMNRYPKGSIVKARPQLDHWVDRQDVEAPQGVQLTCTNRPITYQPPTHPAS